MKKKEILEIIEYVMDSDKSKLSFDESVGFHMALLKMKKEIEKW